MNKQSEVSFPGETINGTTALKSIDDYANAIGSACQESVESILRLAQNCLAADKNLQAENRKKLLEKIPFSASVFSKLVRIGECQHWKLPGATAKLPARYTLLYEMVHIENDRFKDALENEAIYPDISRTEIRKLRGDQNQSDGNGSDPDMPFDDAVEVGLIMRENGMTEQQVSELHSALEKVVSDFGVAVVPHSKKAKRALTQKAKSKERLFKKNALAKVVKEFRELSPDEVKGRLKDIGYKDSEIRQLADAAADEAQQKADDLSETIVKMLPNKSKTA